MWSWLQLQEVVLWHLHCADTDELCLASPDSLFSAARLFLAAPSTSRLRTPMRRRHRDCWDSELECCFRGERWGTWCSFATLEVWLTAAPHNSAEPSSRSCPNLPVALWSEAVVSHCCCSWNNAQLTPYWNDDTLKCHC